MGKNTPVKTAIRIMPCKEENGREKYLILFYGENAYAQLQAGVDSDEILCNGFYAEDHGKAIAYMEVLLEDGVPKTVRAVEE